MRCNTTRRPLSFHRDEGESELNEREAWGRGRGGERRITRARRTKAEKENTRTRRGSQDEREKETREREEETRERERKEPEARERRREEWFTCIASIALAQGQRVCETEDQTGSGPPSFQFPAPCALSFSLPLRALRRSPASLAASLLHRISPFLSLSRPLSSSSRAATLALRYANNCVTDALLLLKAYYTCERLCAPGRVTKYEKLRMTYCECACTHKGIIIISAIQFFMSCYIYIYIINILSTIL